MRRSYLVALLLWMLLGIGGAHRFYCGKHGSGLLYLLTAGLFGVGWMVDFFTLPCLVADANREEPDSSLVLVNQAIGLVAACHLIQGNDDTRR